MEQTRPYLEYSALITFNLLCLLGIILTVVLIIIAIQIKNKVIGTANILQDTAFTVYESVERSKGNVFTAAFKIINKFMK